ncbi:MAG: UDP-N-acetylmuramoyl-L-alanyl-D-glutamate--2,6-diaminopimelate ligase [Synergistales bacterium]|jgi:UDP-N-acetylmuramoyl-L-alanyl-D-glutamate--2,6-diaminopimelate ligase
MDFKRMISYMDKEGLLCSAVWGSGDPAAALDIKRVTHHTSKVTPGSLFCCLPGAHRDGHDFAGEALLKGAAALLCERSLDLEIPQILVSDARKAMALISSFLYDFPSEKLKMIALTGTNGKSTTTYLVRSVLASAGLPSGLLGTIVYHDGKTETLADRTTPESDEIQEWLSRMVENGSRACVMEASSHGLEQGRLWGCRFDAAGFTNLTPEHLDYHGEMEAYFQAKRKLFTEFTRGEWTGAANADDPFGKRLIEEFGGRVIPFGVANHGPETVHANVHSMSLEGIRLDVFFPGGKAASGLKVPLTGGYNLYNILTSAAIAWGLGFGEGVIGHGLEKVPQVPGRLERYLFENGVCCIIDYAHSPDALRNVLKTVGELAGGKIWSVFGMGGDRYAPNRPLMGEAASELADELVITMDNPRSEDPASIARQIEEGLRDGRRLKKHRVILDRPEAIRHALDNARAGDIVLVSGKGPEPYIIIGDKTLPYSDKNVVKEWAEARGLGWPDA